VLMFDDKIMLFDYGAYWVL